MLIGFAFCLLNNMIINKKILGNGKYSDYLFAKYIIDSTIEFDSQQELDLNISELLSMLNGDVSFYSNDKPINVSSFDILIALFRMNRKYVSNGEYIKVFSLKYDKCSANISFSDNTNVVTISNSNFKFIKNGTYISYELYNLLNCN